VSTLQHTDGRRAHNSPLVDPTTANPGVANAALARKRAIRQVAIGLALLVAGLVITGVTYSHASSSPTGGTYIVAWGPMLFGLVTTVRGLRALAQAKRLS
jgi:hypothetical protein